MYLPQDHFLLLHLHHILLKSPSGLLRRVCGRPRMIVKRPGFWRTLLAVGRASREPELPKDLLCIEFSFRSRGIWQPEGEL